LGVNKTLTVKSGAFAFNVAHAEPWPLYLSAASGKYVFSVASAVIDQERSLAAASGKYVWRIADIVMIDEAPPRRLTMSVASRKFAVTGRAAMLQLRTKPHRRRK
jgi:hypothetical protein